MQSGAPSGAEEAEHNLSTIRPRAEVANSVRPLDRKADGPVTRARKRIPLLPSVEEEDGGENVQMAGEAEEDGPDDSKGRPAMSRRGRKDGEAGSNVLAVPKMSKTKTGLRKLQTKSQAGKLE